MNPPNAHLYHDPDPERLRAMLRDSGLTMAKAAKSCGISTRTLERYLARDAHTRGDFMPYPLQYTLEALCALRSLSEADQWTIRP